MGHGPAAGSVPVRRRVEFTPEDIMPSPEAVLRTQGMPTTAAVPNRVAALVPRALEILTSLSQPRAVMENVSPEVFQRIYPGEGRNDGETPLELISPRATDLGLFACTLGEPLSAEIQRLFDEGDLALAVMLDGAASEGAERLVGRLERVFAAMSSSDSSAVLAYSPGYCGWHVSGQRRLFAALAPEEIGITLNPSCLMAPIKSVSGVLVAGPAQIHDFDDDFPCCGSCATRECRARIARTREV